MKAQVFLSYAHTDDDKKKEFEKYLKIMQLTGKADLWTDGALQAGTEWDPKIKAALEASNIIVILITINSLVSDYIRHVEMKRAYQMYKDGKARVICVIMEDCPWEGFPTGIRKADGTDYLLKNFQAVKPHGMAVYDAKQPSLASAMNEAYKQIDRSVEDLLQGGR